MTCTTPCHAHLHRQGHGCLCDTNASRAALGLAPLQQKDGGVRFDGGVAFPIEHDLPDEPLDTPEAAEDRAYVAWSLVCALAVIAFWTIAIYRFTH